MSLSLRESYPATVSSNDDPEKRGRIKVMCAGLVGDESAALPMWVEPALDWGWFYVPDVGEIVEVEAITASSEDEHMGQSSIDNMDLKWRGVRYYGGSETEVGRPVPEDFTNKNYGKRRGFATPGGHILYFDDTDGQRQITLTWADGKGGFSQATVDKDGSVIIGTKAGHLLFMNAKNNEVSLIDPDGNMFATGPGGVKLLDKNKNAIETNGENVQVLAQGGCTISCKNASIDAGLITLGGAAAIEPLIKGNVFLTLFSNHTHPTGVGPSGPPIVGAGGNPALWAAFLSQVSKTV